MATIKEPINEKGELIQGATYELITEKSSLKLTEADVIDLILQLKQLKIKETHPLLKENIDLNYFNYLSKKIRDNENFMSFQKKFIISFVKYNHRKAVFYYKQQMGTVHKKYE